MTKLISLPALVAAALLSQASPASSSTQPVTATPLPTPVATPAAPVTPVATPAAQVSPPVPTATPAAVQAAPTFAPTCGVMPAASLAPAPIATPTYQYRFVPRQPDQLAPCQPQIFIVELNSKDLVSAGDIDIHVVTNQYVTRVVSKNGGREGTIPKVGPSDFIAFSKLPKLPFIARGMSLDLQFVAYGVDGKTVTVSVPVKLH